MGTEEGMCRAKRIRVWEMGGHRTPVGTTTKYCGHVHQLPTVQCPLLCLLNFIARGWGTWGRCGMVTADREEGPG